MFLLPDRNEFLQAIDAFEGGVERRPAMGRGDDDCDAGLADQHAPETVDHRDVGDLVLRGDLAADSGQHLERHGFVALVVEAEGRAAPGVVADDALEDYDRSVAPGLHARGEGANVDSVPGQGKVVAALDDVDRVGTGAAAYRREEGDLVAFGQRCRKRGKLLISRDYDARRELPDAGMKGR
jgi:hypothetical protein